MPIKQPEEAEKNLAKEALFASIKIDRSFRLNHTWNELQADIAGDWQ
jgi:hypothetical protein